MSRAVDNAHPCYNRPQEAGGVIITDIIIVVIGYNPVTRMWLSRYHGINNNYRRSTAEITRALRHNQRSQHLLLVMLITDITAVLTVLLTAA